MPWAAPQPCPRRGCPNLTDGGPCADCRRKSEQRRGSAAARGYDHRWRTSRDAFLREFPLCGMRPGGRAPVLSRCHDEGRVTPAEQVDHVDPHRGDSTKFWDRDGNWQSLCRWCGARKSALGQ